MLTECLETSKGGKWELWAFAEHKCGKSERWEAKEMTRTMAFWNDVVETVFFVFQLDRLIWKLTPPRKPVKVWCLIEAQLKISVSNIPNLHIPCQNNRDGTLKFVEWITSVNSDTSQGNLFDTKRGWADNL